MAQAVELIMVREYARARPTDRHKVASVRAFYLREIHRLTLAVRDRRSIPTKKQEEILERLRTAAEGDLDDHHGEAMRKVIVTVQRILGEKSQSQDFDNAKCPRLAAAWAKQVEVEVD